MAITEFNAAINQVAAERGIPVESVLESVKSSLATAYKKDRKDFAAARPIINGFVRNSKNVYITVNLWPLIDNVDDVKFFDGFHFKTGDTLVIQQMYLPFANEFLNKCTIIYDWRTAEKRKFLGIPLTNTPQGYSFTVCRVN